MAETKSDDVTIVESNERFKVSTYASNAVLKTTIKSTTYSDKSQKHMVQLEFYDGEKSYKDVAAWDLAKVRRIHTARVLSADAIVSVLSTKPMVANCSQSCMLVYNHRDDPVCIILLRDGPSGVDTLKKEVAQMTGQIADLESRVGMYADEIANQIAEKGDLAAKCEVLRVENARFKAALRSLGLMN